MTRRHAWISAGLAGSTTALIAATAVPAAAVPAAPHGPKNVIVLIGDGMGYNQAAEASLYENGTSSKQVATDPATGAVTEVQGTPSQAHESFPVQVDMQTFASGGSYDPQQVWTDFDYVKNGATDSGAAGTAMATGVKTYNGGIGVDPAGNEIENISERAISMGKAAGVVSSVPFSHATPAAYAVHDESRNNYHAIADKELASELSVVMGAGHPYYDDDNQPLETPAYDYISSGSYEALAAGQTEWSFVEDGADFEALTAGDAPEKVFGVAQVGSTLQQGRAGASGQPYGDPLNEVPSLATMTAGALNVLDGDEDGFSLMVEGGAIDWAGHANDSARNIEETLAFNDAVDTVVDWVEENSSWKETLVVVTADHETGYLEGPGADPAWSTLDGASGAVPAGSWNSGGHTNMLVPVYAKGAGAKELDRRARMTDPVRGAYLDNTDLANLLLEDLWAEGPGASAGNGSPRGREMAGR
ncbi:alkaline phosphatase [Kocuria aegyptia]|uniref:Alkaline phosphatase n=1 Tax=Kocuria aegyptia TaxID=330943 RepID=A0ABN2KWN6_9MICC